MYSFVLGVIFTLGVGGALYLAFLVGRKSIASEELPIELDETSRRKQEIQEQQIDDFSRMMSYDIDVAYDRKSEV